MIDRLIVAIEAQDKFTPTAQQIERSADSLARKLAMLQSAGRAPGLPPAAGSSVAISAFLANINPVTVVLSAIAVAATAGLAVLGGYAFGLLKLGEHAVSAASEMQALEATLTAVTGSAESASRKMTFLRRFARESVFEFQDLARAGTLLESFGLRMERVLPIIARLGAVFGAESGLIDQLASAFGRIGAGQFGEAMEILRRFGISAQALRAHGVQMSASGQVLSSAESVLLAVEAIVLERFGNITESMSKTLVVQLSNLRDAVFQTFETVGRAILPHIQAFVGRVSELLTALRASGWIDRIASAFGSLAESLSAKLVAVLPSAIGWLTTLIEFGPQLFRVLIDSAWQFAESITSALLSVGNAIIQLYNTIIRLSGPLARAFGLSPISPLQPDTQFSPVLSLISAMDQRATEIAEQILSAATGPERAVETGEAAGSFWNRQQDLTAEIAQNTRETKQLLREQIDFQRLVLGGGERASFGLTPVERAGLTRSAESFVESVVERMLRLRVARHG